jgi:hypothetical protein
MMGSLPTKIEFYSGLYGEESSFLVATVEADAVPRVGEMISIKREVWRVARVTWALDTSPTQWRANVEMRKASDVDTVE